MLATITIGIDPEPLTLTWHGVFIAVGIVVGGLFASRYARERGLDREHIPNAVVVIAIAGIVAARLFYLLENDPAALVNPADWLGTRGFAFYGAIILGTPAAALYARRAGLGSRYLDALAAGFPAGMAVGRLATSSTASTTGLPATCRGPSDTPTPTPWCRARRRPITLAASTRSCSPC